MSTIDRNRLDAALWRQTSVALDHAVLQAARSAARLQALRDIGCRIMRETGGKISVVIPVEQYDAEADVLMEQQPFIPAEPMPAPQKSAAEIEADLQQVRQLTAATKTDKAA